MSWEALDNHWKKILEQDDNLEKKILLAEFIEKLSLNINFDQDNISNLVKKNKLLQVFIYFKKTGEECNRFFDNSLDSLDSKRATFKDTILEIKNKIQEITIKYTSLEEENKSLLENEEELIKESNNFEKLEKRLSYLEEINEKVKPENIDILLAKSKLLEVDVEEKELMIKDIETAYLQVKNELDTLDEIILLRNSEINQETGKFKLLTEHLEKLLSKEINISDSKLLTFRNKLSSRIEQYNNITKELDSCTELFDEALSAFTKNNSLYSKHFNENENIKNLIEKNKNIQDSNITEHIISYSNIIKDNLYLFDKELKKYVEISEQIKKEKQILISK